MAIEDIGSSAPSQLKLSEATISFLKEIAKWTNFLSIVGFVFLGLIILGAIFGGAVFASLSAIPEFGGNAAMGGTFITVFYLIFAVIYFFPIYYLNKFSSNMKAALRAKDNEALSKAFEYMKSHYKFVGILTIIVLSLYVLGLLLAVLGLAAAGF